MPIVQQIQLRRAKVDHANQERIISTALSYGDELNELTSNLDLSTLDASIQVTHIGNNFQAAIQAEIDKLEQHQLASVYIDLPFCAAAAAHAYLTFEKLGFFFGSWLPNFWKDQDIPRMQKSYTQLNESEIICARDQGNLIKEYILSEMKRLS